MYWELIFSQKFFISRYTGAYYHLVLICVGKTDYRKSAGSFIKKVFPLDFRFCHDHTFQGQSTLVKREVDTAYQHAMTVCDYS